MRRRILVALTALIALISITITVTGCTPAESYETAVPAALVASDLGISSAQAYSSVDGLASDYSVEFTLDRGAITSAELREILEIIVENTDSTRFTRLELRGIDASSEDKGPVDSGAIDDELGFTTHRTATVLVDAQWDDVVESFGN